MRSVYDYVPSPGSHSSIKLKDLKEVMLQVPQPYFYWGRSYTICTKRLCPGVYKIWLEEWKG